MNKESKKRKCRKLKKLIYSQEDLDLILSLETQEYEDKLNNLQSKIDKAIEYIEENIDLEMDDFTKIDIGCEILKILDLDKYNEFLKEESK